ncbi:MAG TPA: hypothetical protein VKM55_15320 [Candidatus Lokiarchaeia archaeon]|nr:hypothetical protein [Candidatus Lokiarchaeia archaeon]
MNAIAIQDFVAGKFSKKISYVYLVCVLGVYIGFIVASLVVFPGTYSILTNAISNLGNHGLNPFPGWLYFSIGLWFFGPATVPIFLYQYRAMSRALRWSARSFLVLSTIASAGMIGVGIFSEDLVFLFHVTFAAMAFGGLIFSSLFSWFAIIAMTIKEQDRRTKKILATILCFMVAVVVGVAASIGTVYIDINVYGVAEAGWINITFWEWMLFLTLAFQSILLTVQINIAHHE